VITLQDLTKEFKKDSWIWETNDKDKVEVILPSVEIIDSMDGVSILKKLEKIIRVAYKSEDKITDTSYEKMLNVILANNHLSTLEHEHITFKIVTNRGVTHELVRHRLANYTQESTRYVNYSKKGGQVIYPAWMVGKSDKDKMFWYARMCSALMGYNQAITEFGWKPQEARGILPHDVKTEIYSTMNLRELRHVDSLRGEGANAAHPDIRIVISELMSQLQSKIPIIFDEKV
jgi:thymidylate synthase (FAD)